MANALLNGSAVKVFNILPPGASINGGASTAAVNLAQFEGATVIVSVGSAPTLSSGGGAFTLMRSATSNGTFQGVADLGPIGTKDQAVVRAIAVATSATWHKVFYTNSSGGAMYASIEIVAHNPRYEPVNQESLVVTQADILRV